MDKLVYITYQSFPSIKANTFQTFENLKYICLKVSHVELIFPKREITSSDSVELLNKSYEIPKNLKIEATQHNLPFGKFGHFKKLSYLFSHYSWSKKQCKKISRNSNKFFITRSDWVFYFLSKKGLKVTFECHQLSKIRKIIMKKSIKYNNSKIIFLNEQLCLDSGIKLKKYDKKLIVLQNGVDVSIFTEKIQKETGQLIFLGNLNRFDESRNLKFVIDCFRNPNLKKNYFLKIIGGPTSEVEVLNKYIQKHNLESRVVVKDRMSRKLAIKEIESSEIGLLINSSKNIHSVKYTSPLKYFEYLYGELKILAVDFYSHKSLPFSENIVFFNENNEDSFVAALNSLENVEPISKKNLNPISLETRVSNILNFINN